MAKRDHSVPGNVEGEFYVDTSCFNCGVSRHFAPTLFGDDGQFAYVKKQPDGPDELLAAQRAQIACPVAAIGTRTKLNLGAARASLPLELADGVFINGFNDEKSFGAHSYFIASPEGNWMIDAPRFSRHLVTRFEEMGGIDYIFLSHRDDVADAARYARHFGAKRIIHALEAHAQRDAEIILDGDGDHTFGAARIIFTPGHTAGHMVACWQGKYLFTGDHFAWLQATGRFGSFRNHCWYSWNDQIASVEKLATLKAVDWVLPGHGMWGQVPSGRFPEIIAAAVRDMRADC